MSDALPQLRSYIRTSDPDYSYQVGLLDGVSGASSHVQDGGGYTYPTDLDAYEAGFLEGMEHRAANVIKVMQARVAGLRGQG